MTPEHKAEIEAAEKAVRDTFSKDFLDAIDKLNIAYTVAGVDTSAAKFVGVTKTGLSRIASTDIFMTDKERKSRDEAKEKSEQEISDRREADALLKAKRAKEAKAKTKAT